MCGNVFEIGDAIEGPRDTLSVIADHKVLTAMPPAAGDFDFFGVCVNAVLNKFGDSLERIALRKCDDTDGIPVVADPQFPSFGEVRLVCVSFLHGKMTG